MYLLSRVNGSSWQPTLTLSVAPSPSLRASSLHHPHPHQDKLLDLCWCMALFRAGVGNPAPRAMWHFLTMLDIFQLQQQGTLAATQGVTAWARGMGWGGKQGQYVF